MIIYPNQLEYVAILLKNINYDFSNIRNYIEQDLEEKYKNNERR
jgi:hypothetical protein